MHRKELTYQRYNMDLGGGSNYLDMNRIYFCKGGK
jgi:hypothetical protein